MRRSALALLTAALLSLTLVSPLSGASAGPVTQAPGKTKVNGKLSIEPSSVTIGQKVKVGANFSNGVYMVTLYRQESGSSSWDEVAVDESNASGNAWFHDVQIDTKQKLYARITDGSKAGITNTMTITPTVPVEPAADPTGELYTQPLQFAEGQPVEVVANFDSGAFDVSLYRKVGDVWTKVGTDTKRRASGNAYFKGFVVKEGEELFALRSNGESTPAKSFSPVEILPGNFPEAPGSTLAIQGKVYDGRKGPVLANFPSGTFDVTVFRNKGGEWVPEGTARSNSSGDASIAIEFDGGDDYFALASNGQRTPETKLVPSPPSDVSGGPSTLGHHVIYVTTNNGGTPTTRGVDYESKAVLASGDEESKTLDVEEFAVRGNSTSTKPKKPYKIKFDDDLEPFGLAEDNNFVLLANYLDWTLVRGEVAFSLGRQLTEALPWTPRSAYAELFLNGKYMGSYQMVESIKLDKNRVKVADKKTAQIIEFDPHYKEDGVPGMSGQTGVKYSWKDPDEHKFFDPGEKDCPDDAPEPCPDPEGLTNAKITDMKTKIKNFEKVLYGTDNKLNWATYQPPTPADDWKTYLDLDSAVDYYLVKEFTKDQDADMFRSNYFYTNNVDPNSPDKFFMGPLWDFDRSAGATPDDYFTGVSKPTGWWMRGDGSVEHDTNKIHWYTRIAKDPVFLQALEDRWDETKHLFENAGRSGDAPGGEVSEAVTKIGGIDDYALGRTVAENDRARWKGFGSRYYPKTSNYGKEVEWLRTWYDKRFAWMNSQLD